jgi:hypothetical protein
MFFICSKVRHRAGHSVRSSPSPRRRPINPNGKPQITRFRTIHQSDMSFRTKIGRRSPLRCADLAMYGKHLFADRQMRV